MTGTESETVTAAARRSNRYAHHPTVTFPTPNHPLSAQGGPFRVWLAPINVPSDDRRVIVDTLGWREPPLPFLSSDSEMGHGDAVHTGNLTDFALETVDGEQWVTAALTFDTDEQAVEFERLATEGKFNGVSIHMGKADFWPVLRLDDGSFQRVSFDELDAMIDAAQSEDDVSAILDTIYDGAFDAEIAAATQVAIPAFPGAQIETVTVTETDAEPEAEPVAASAECGCKNRVVVGSVHIGSDGAVQAAALDRPPADWFTDPALDGPTPLTVTDDGRVYGHLALWDTCHTGYRDRCVSPPRDADYSTFLTASVYCDDGTRVAVGPLVVDDGHAPADWAMDRVQSYYANTVLAGAYVAAGPDDHGVWVAGAVSHKATDGQIETLRRHPLSGDWRPYQGRYRLVAAVSVNSPGFPIPQVMVASGEPVGLITYGPHDPKPSEMALVASALDLLAAQVADLRERARRADAEAERPQVDAAAAVLLDAL